MAEGRTLGDPQTVHYGLVPRTNRGIFSVNELPDLAERIQVALLNVLEERDIQVRGYALRLPLDLMLIASANPEDYTNRGRIITPLKDRFGAEVRTHYPLRLDDELALMRQESLLQWEGPFGQPVVPDYLVEVLARFTRAVREAPQVDGRSGVSARLAIAATETVAASAVRRAAVTGELPPVARVGRPRRRSCRPCAARSSSTRSRRDARRRCWRTCCAGRPPTRSAPGCRASTFRGCRSASRRRVRSRPVSCCPARRCWPRSARSRASRRC